MNLVKKISRRKSTTLQIKLRVSFQGKALLWVARFTREWLFLPVDVQHVIETIVSKHVWITLPSGKRKRLSEIGSDMSIRRGPRDRRR